MRVRGLVRRSEKKSAAAEKIRQTSYGHDFFFSSESWDRVFFQEKIFVAGRNFWARINFHEFRSSPILQSFSEGFFSKPLESSENELWRRATVQNDSPGSGEHEKIGPTSFPAAHKRTSGQIRIYGFRPNFRIFCYFLPKYAPWRHQNTVRTVQDPFLIDF